MLEIHSLQAFKSIASAYSATTAYKYEVFVNFDARLLKINNVKNFKSLASAYSTTRAYLVLKRNSAACVAEFLLEAPPGFEPGHKGFADLGLTAWL